MAVVLHLTWWGPLLVALLSAGSFISTPDSIGFQNFASDAAVISALGPDHIALMIVNLDWGQATFAKTGLNDNLSAQWLRLRARNSDYERAALGAVMHPAVHGRGWEAFRDIVSWIDCHGAWCPSSASVI
jgi:hypothetical protein